MSARFKKGDRILFVEALPGGKIKVYDDWTYVGKTVSKDWHHVKKADGTIVTVKRNQFTEYV